jgi:hypothetical protein
MKLGIGLPNTMAHETDRKLMLDWARLADEAGFHVLGTIDKPNFDSWDPLVTLAGAAAVTERARLATAILQLPNRNEVLVAKQAAVVDQLSGGRLDLGIAQGGRRRLPGPRRRVRRALGALRAAGDPHPRDLGKCARVRSRARGPRASSRSGARPAHLGRCHATEGRLARDQDRRRLHLRHCGEPGHGTGGAGDPGSVHGERKARCHDRRSCLRRRRRRPAEGADEGAHHVLRYYGQLWTEPENLIHHGPATKIAEEVAAYADAVDLLILFAEIPSLDQVEQLAEHVLPAYR